MEWVKTILNAVRVAVDTVGTALEKLKTRVQKLEDWAKPFTWIPEEQLDTTELIPETAISGDGNAQKVFDISSMPDVGEQCQVRWNGKEYTCTVEEIDLGELGYTQYIGANPLVGQTFATYPFFVGFGATNSGTYQAIVLGSTATATVSVSLVYNKNELPQSFIHSAVSAIYKKIGATDSSVADLTKKLSGKANVQDMVVQGRFKQNASTDVSIGDMSHTCGVSSAAKGYASFAEGMYTIAKGAHSHTAGTGTISFGNDQFVIGRYNVEDTMNGYATIGHYLFIIGNGSKDDIRRNAFTVSNEGQPWSAVRPRFGYNHQEVMANGDTKITLKSSVAGSTKTFDLSVDDNGVLPESFYAPAVPIPVTQAKYDAMLEAGKIDENRFYFIVEKEGDSI